MNNTHHKTVFRWFLAVYIAVLLLHIIEVPWNAGLIITFVLGFIFATLAHFRSGTLTIVLLLVHMALEWTGYASHGSHYDTSELIFLGVHGVLDIAFLWQEVSAHLARYRTVIMTIVSGGIICALAAAHLLPHAELITEAAHGHEHTSFLEPLVLGGILGCTLWHIGIWKQNRK